MIARRDRISRPKSGRFFPLSIAEALTNIRELAFQVHPIDNRLPLLFENCDVECDFGHQLASFLRQNYLAVFSLPESIDRDLARRAAEHAIREFAGIDRQPRLTTREQQIVIYRAYLDTGNTVSITQDIVSAGNRSYLWFRKISKISRSQSRPHHEILLGDVRLDR